MKLDHRSLEDYGDAYIPMFDPPVIIDRHIPTALCAHLVSELDRCSDVASGVHDAITDTAKVDSYHRSSSAVSVPKPLYNDMAKLLTTIIASYTGILLAKTPTLSEPLQFLKYEASKQGHFLAHTDNAYYDGQGKFRYTSPHRHLSCLAYINDDYEGGELIMHTVRDESMAALRLKPKIGEVVIFPSDIRFLHEVTNVTKGRRYSVVGWFCLK